jgi:hypothetical protein
MNTNLTVSSPISESIQRPAFPYAQSPSQGWANSLKKVAGTLRVPSAELQKALLFRG